MISHKHKVIYIHPPKTGGSSIETAFTGRDWWHVIDPSSWPTNWNPHTNPHTSILKHVTVDEAKKMYFAEWRQYFKFGTVRHPYKWCASLYLHCKHRIEECGGAKSFHEFVMNHPATSLYGHGNNWSTKWGIPQTRWFTPFCRMWMDSPDEDNLTRLPMCDGNFADCQCDEEGLWRGTNQFGQNINDIFIIKLEDIKKGFAEVKKIIDSPELHLPHTNRKRRPVSYDDMLTDEIKKRIFEIYKEDFTNFGYDA